MNYTDTDNNIKCINLQKNDEILYPSYYFNSNDINYDTISSSIINVTFNPTLSFTTLSSVINLSPITKLNIITNQNYIINTTSFWYRVNTQPIFSQSTNLIMLDYNNGLLCGFNGSLNITNNGGKTWTQINSNTTSTILNFYAWDINNILIITSNKISLTNNTGLNWTDMSGEYINQIILGGDFFYDTGYIICNDGYIYKSVNYGRYWLKHVNIGSILNVIKILGRNNITISVNSTLYFLFDGGITNYSNINVNNYAVKIICYISTSEILVVSNNISLRKKKKNGNLLLAGISCPSIQSIFFIL